MSLRKGITILIAVAILTGLLSVPHVVWAGEEPTAEGITIDVVLIRPAGVVSLAAGTVIFAVSSPLALLTGSEKSAAKKLIVEPYKFTFQRPLGEY